MKQPEVIIYRMLRAQQDVLAMGRKQRLNLWFTFEQGDILPEWPCCYAIYHDGRLVYVGQTVNLAARFIRHRQAGSKMVIKAKLCRRFGEWATAEVRLIARLKPSLNQVGTYKRRAA